MVAKSKSRQMYLKICTQVNLKMLYLKFIFGKIAPDLIEFCTQNDLITDYKSGLGIF